MNIESSTLNKIQENKSVKTQNNRNNESSATTFADELKDNTAVISASDEKEVSSKDKILDKEDSALQEKTNGKEENIEHQDVDSSYIINLQEKTNGKEENIEHQDIDSSYIINLQEKTNGKEENIEHQDVDSSYIINLQEKTNGKEENIEHQDVDSSYVINLQEKTNGKEENIEHQDVDSSYIINLQEKKIDNALNDLQSVVEKLNQSEDKDSLCIKNSEDVADNDIMINNDFNIKDNKDLIPQMAPNMNFSGNGQSFSSFMNNESKDEHSRQLNSSAQDLAEEAAILSTMAENIAIANKQQALQKPLANVEKSGINEHIIEKEEPVLNQTRTISNEDEIKKVDAKTGIKIETIVHYDTIILSEADVEVFTSLVEKGEINLQNLAPDAASRGAQISKTLADMLAKAMENNQPVRINFDNDVSVIIRISRDGKISADFLPSSQVAEAYLKENLPILRQRFEENNIEYDSLEQKERQNSEKKDNRKKDRNNE